MHKAKLILTLEEAEKIARSIAVDKDMGVKVKHKNNKLVIEIEQEKLSHLKAIINSYLTLVNMLKEV